MKTSIVQKTFFVPPFFFSNFHRDKTRQFVSRSQLWKDNFYLREFSLCAISFLYPDTRLFHLIEKPHVPNIFRIVIMCIGIFQEALYCTHCVSECGPEVLLAPTSGSQIPTNSGVYRDCAEGQEPPPPCKQVLQKNYGWGKI